MERSSLLLRFFGHRSSLLLIWPTAKNEPMLLRYPFYACASGRNWGKVTRGIEANWTLLEGKLHALFHLSVSGITTNNIGYIGTESISFTAKPEQGAPGGPPAFTGFDESEEPTEASFWPWNRDKSVMRFTLGEPLVREGTRQRFLVTTKGILEEEDGEQANETTCTASPLVRAMTIIGHPFKAIARRLRRSAKGAKN